MRQSEVATQNHEKHETVINGFCCWQSIFIMVNNVSIHDQTYKWTTVKSSFEFATTTISYHDGRMLRLYEKAICVLDR